jgi:tetratricopeptide (TPR) repeat protein
MNRNEIEACYHSVLQDVSSGKLAFAIGNLKRLIRQSTRTDYFYELESIEENYRSLLKYTYEGYQDPKRGEILRSISAAALHLADELTLFLTEDAYPFRKMSRLSMEQEFGTEAATIADKLDELFFSRRVSELMDTGTSQPPAVTDPVFKLIWLTPELKEPHHKLLRHLIRDEGIQWHEKCLAVSALTLSLLLFFDLQKFQLLHEPVVRREPQIYHRALTGLVLALIRYDARIRHYPVLTTLVNDLSRDEEARKDIETIILQLLMAGETERITREFEQEVLPDMQKMMPKLSDKLRLDEVVESGDPEDQNPVWKEMIEEVPGLFEKIEKFSRMQMEGADVFMSTFAMLKRFDFFSSMSNWFAPFYPSHPSLRKESVEEEGIHQRLLEGLLKAFYICNSDRYSFALNFQAIPAQQRSLIVTHFEAELEQMREMISEEELIEPALVSNSIFTQYIQDLYRFYRLFPQHAEFEDIFRRNQKLHRLGFIRGFPGQETFTEQLAAFYFAKDHWTEAIEMYSFLAETGRPSDQLYQKLGFAWQKTGNWAQAQEAYRKAELFDTDRPWLLKKLALCSIRLNDFRQALIYIREALENQPEDLNLQAQAGQCCLKLKEYDNAIKHYTRIRYYSPGNLKALRPIAYCRFIQGNLDLASEAYEEILHAETDPGPYDLMNAGHVAFCQGDRKRALELYRASLRSADMTEELFVRVFGEDVPFLVQQGVMEQEIPLLIDFLLMG